MSRAHTYFLTYQGLLLTMLGRTAVLELGVPLGAALLILMLLPTLLMSLQLTPHVLKNIATANAVYEVEHDCTMTVL